MVDIEENEIVELLESSTKEAVKGNYPRADELFENGLTLMEKQDFSPEITKRLTNKAYWIFAKNELEIAKKYMEYGQLTAAEDRVEEIECKLGKTDIGIPSSVIGFKLRLYETIAQECLEEGEKDFKNKCFDTAEYDFDRAENYLKRIDEGGKLPEETLKTRTKVYEERAREEMEEAEKYIEEGIFSFAEVCLNQVEEYSEKAGIEVPETVPDMKTGVYKKLVQIELIGVEREIEKGNFYFVKTDLERIERYSRLANMDIPKEVYKLREMIEQEKE